LLEAHAGNLTWISVASYAKSTPVNRNYLSNKGFFQQGTPARQRLEKRPDEPAKTVQTYPVWVMCGERLCATVNGPNKWN
jgi:hypothetical protein